MTSGLERPHPRPQAAPPAAAPADDEDDELLLASFSDVVAAISMLVGQHQLQRRGLPPVALKSQLHTVLKDRTASDRELDELQRRGEVRTFRMPTGEAPPGPRAAPAARGRAQLRRPASRRRPQARTSTR
jgi:hypothetical protein